MVLLPRCALVSGRFDLATLCGLIASKELRVAGHLDGQPGLSSILIHSFDLAVLAEHVPLPSKLVGHQALARALGCSTAAARSLAKNHIRPELQCVRRQKGRRVPLFSKTTIGNFESAAISLRELRTRTLHQQWSVNLKKIGLTALHDGGRDSDTFYPRDAVEELLCTVGP